MNWIAIEHAKPERGKGVLVYLASGFITVAYWFNQENVTYWNVYGDLKNIVPDDDRVTHWQPLPPAPL